MQEYNEEGEEEEERERGRQEKYEERAPANIIFFY